MAELSDLDRAMLAFERLWFKRPVAKEERIRSDIGLTPVGYYARLNALIDRPEALAFDAPTVNRLRRLRAHRGRNRRPIRRIA